jgi:5-methyltetrahydropteroyltriglutamate--homocysteine methyltransferase
LATRRDAGSELKFAVDLVNRIVEGIDGIRTGVHICRGNWSKQDSVHLSGDYEPLVPSLSKINVQQLVLEFATPRAGDFGIVGRNLNNREIGLGVASPKTEEVESVEYIVGKVEKALEHYQPENIFLNPDCGFGTFSGCSITTHEAASAKMKRIVEAAKLLRERYAGRAERKVGEAAA